MLETFQAQIDCRYARMPACDPVGDASPSANVPAVGVFQLRSRDTLDFGIDLRDWLAANFSPEIANVAWTVAPNSPHVPIIVGSSYEKDSRVSVVLTPNAGATGGNSYFLEAAIQIAPVAAQTGIPALPARTLHRRIHIVVVNG
jgi:hypothetical protein